MIYRLQFHIKYCFCLTLLVFSCSSKKSNFKDVVASNPSISATFENQEAEELYYSANTLLNNGKYAESIELYDEALKIEPTNTSVLSHKSIAIAKTGDFDLAISVISSAIELDPNSGEYYNNRGLYYYKTKRNRLALENFQKSIELRPLENSTYINLGLTHHYLGNKSKSCEAFKKGIELGYPIDKDEFSNSIYIKSCNL